jgi:3',5'-cyclic AMP phosphodiesterase CpdA
MRTVVHLSDLHFGRIDPATLAPLEAAVKRLEPHAVVVSGDLTQRARAAQFREARAFLDRLPKPQVVVPGNHDVPLYRVWERFLAPYGKYRKYFSPDLEPTYQDDEIALVGVNTARALTFKNGRINREQIEAIARRLAPFGEHVLKVVVTHHPFDLPDKPDEDEKDDLVGAAKKAMQAFSRCGIDVLLAGHFHVSDALATSARYDLPGYAALAVQAGTATSTRGRGEANAFNVLRMQSDAVTVERHEWRPEAGAFVHADTEAFRREGQRWIEVTPPDAKPSS